MVSEYEKIVSSVCGSNWNSSEISLEERDGAYGVAMVLAALRGSRTNINDLSYAIRVPVQNLERAYKRLMLNGIFHQTSYIWNDQLLRGEVSDREDSLNVNKAWCYIAGMASGFIFRVYSRFDHKSR